MTSLFIYSLCHFRHFSISGDKGMTYGVITTNLNVYTSFSCKLHPDNEADDEDSDWLVHNHFDVLTEQMATLQAQLIDMKIN